MHYKLIGFSQEDSVRTFRFHRIGAIGTQPIAFRVVANTSAARQHKVPLQDLPSLCTRLLQATADAAPASALTIGESDLAEYAAELDIARAEVEANAKRRSLASAHLRAQTASAPGAPEAEGK